MTSLDSFDTTYDFRPCYNKLFQIMEHDNFRNLNRVTFTQ